MSTARKSIMRRMANSLVERWVGRAYVEEFQGDLEEMYEDRLETRGKFAAESMYWIDALHLIIGFSSTEKKQSHSMFIGNMVKIAWRSAARHKQFTVLNLLGLTLGIATCVAIGLYVYEESSYDTFHAKGDRIYRINQPMIWGDWTEQFSATGPGVTEAIRSDIPDFEQVTRIYFIGEVPMRVTSNGEATHFNESNYYAADENFFQVFSFPFLKGDPNTALKEPNTMVITESTARRYFGDSDPLGKTIETKSTTGTYTPFIVLRLDGAWAVALAGAVWAIAGLGIVAKLLRLRWIEPISVGLYLLLGWIGLVAIGPFMHAMDVSTLVLLGAGGFLYTVGVIFHLWRALPFQNAIWHAFVLLGAGLHYGAVLTVV